MVNFFHNGELENLNVSKKASLIMVNVIHIGELENFDFPKNSSKKVSRTCQKIGNKKISNQ